MMNWGRERQVVTYLRYWPNILQMDWRELAQHSPKQLTRTGPAFAQGTDENWSSIRPRDRRELAQHSPKRFTPGFETDVSRIRSTNAKYYTETFGLGMEFNFNPFYAEYCSYKRYSICTLQTLHFSASCILMHTGGSYAGGKEAGAWIWPLTLI